MNFSFLLTLYAGFTHAFETDHLLAVSNIVTNRNKFIKAVKDGMYWGLGHTSTIFFIGIIILLLKFRIAENYFSYFEAIVGCMLILLGIYRVVKWFQKKKPAIHSHPHTHADGNIHAHTHLHIGDKTVHEHSHLPAYGVGLIHGLAGSGSLMILVLAQMKTVSSGLLYLLIFGVGSIGGMMVAAGFFSLPFNQKLLHSKLLQMSLVFLSAGLCIGYGGWVVYKNLHG
jgi:hypothetical protein